MLRPMPPPPSVPVEEMLARLDRALASSPADETELVWIEARRGQESNGKRRRDSFEIPERNLLVRVREAGRLGLHRTNTAGLSDLENAIRDALGQARLARRTPQPPPSGAAGPLPRLPELADPEIGRMSQSRARDLIQRHAERGEIGWLGWAEGRMAVINSRGLRRATEVTAAWLVASCGRGPGAGRAAAAARSLDALDPGAVFERARQRHVPAGGPTAGPPETPGPLVLSPEAAAALIDLLNREALGSSTFPGGALRGRLGEPVCHPAVTLRDDGTDPRGLPFPFDFLGAAKLPVELIERGVLRTPAVDEELAAAIGLPPTPHLIAPDEAVATHLFLEPGEEPDEELLRRAGGGLWVTWLDAPRAFDPAALRFRAHLRGVRRLEDDGALGAPVPDLVWEDHLLALLERVLGVGRTAVTAVAAADPLFGATTAPMLAFERVEGLTPRS